MKGRNEVSFSLSEFHNMFLNDSLFHLYRENQLVFGYYGGVREDIER